MTTKLSPGPGKPLLDYFPFESIRPTQRLVLQELEKVWATGKKTIILEAPVGSGKSPIAIAVSRWIEANPPTFIATDEVPVEPLAVHLLTPRKSLQDQYYADFSEDISLMKGRNSYPCTHDSTVRVYGSVSEAIKRGETPGLAYSSVSCSEGPCKDSKDVFLSCNGNRPCPYNLAMLHAQESEIVVHNLHSFLYQTNFSFRFEKRRMMIVDECHELQNTLREFTIRKVFLNHPVTDEDVAGLKTLKQWETFLLQPKFIPQETAEDKFKKAADKEYKSNNAKYLERIESLMQKEETYNKGFSTNLVPNLQPGTQKHLSTSIEFIPHYVGGEANRLIFDHGEKMLLMSGTIYSKNAFCAALGLNIEDTHFIRIPSSFPKENRPIYMKPEYQVDTSHANWNDNFGEMIEITKKIMTIFGDAKGLIHAPSYYAAQQMAEALQSRRIVTHEAGNFLTSLQSFFERKDNSVFISPVCQQGVDFKDDRARFQIVIRVPYLNTSSSFIQDKMRQDFPWYNYQALVVFGQQIGRVNRSEEDYGATFLLDARFNQFIQRNHALLPTWLTQAIIKK